MTKRTRLFRLAGILGLAMILLAAAGSTAILRTLAQEPSREEKHLVIKVVEDEELVEIDDFEVPLAAYSAGSEDHSSGTRHLILMAGMLVCLILFVFYQGRNEKKLIFLRIQAAKAQRQRMTANRKT